MTYPKKLNITSTAVFVLGVLLGEGSLSGSEPADKAGPLRIGLGSLQRLHR
jgi:hypothetical protein